MDIANDIDRRPVYRALHRPLTLLGVDRRLFFLALLVGAAAFNLFYSLLAGCLLFVTIYGFARWSTARDPQMLQILLRAGRAPRRYDATRRNLPSLGVGRG
jgi:type IV secretory pathway TrbD component